DLDAGRFSAQAPYAAADGIAWRSAGGARAPAGGGSCDALWQSIDRVGARASEESAVRPDHGVAALSAVLGHYHGIGIGCRVRLVSPDTQCAGTAAGSRIPRSWRVHFGAAVSGRAALGSERPWRQAADELPRRAAAHADAGRPLSL